MSKRTRIEKIQLRKPRGRNSLELSVRIKKYSLTLEKCMKICSSIVKHLSQLKTIIIELMIYKLLISA